MKNKLCILFLYHKCDALTLFHFKQLKESNPYAAVIPLTDSVPDLLPGSIDVSQFPSRWTTSGKWRNIDVTVYRWFEKREFDAEKYLFVEYDCFCTVDLIKHYEKVWDSDVAGVDFFSRSENPNWLHFSKDELAYLPPDDLPYASAIVPFTCTLFSHNALAEFIHQTSKNDTFCELRLGTTVRKLGLYFKRLPLSVRKTICWHPYPWQINRPGLFHSIKSLDHNSMKRRQPDHVRAFFHDIGQSCSSERILGSIRLPNAISRRLKYFFAAFAEKK